MKSYLAFSLEHLYKMTEPGVLGVLKGNPIINSDKTYAAELVSTTNAV